MYRELIQSELDRIVALVSEEPSVQRVFLFGSAVKPESLTEGSDLDICIVQKTERPFYDRLAEWILKIQPEVGLDLVVYRPEEFDQMIRENYFVRSEISEKGREIYHAA